MAGARLSIKVHIADAFPDPGEPATNVDTRSGIRHTAPSSVRPITADSSSTGVCSAGSVASNGAASGSLQEKRTWQPV